MSMQLTRAFPASLARWLCLAVCLLFAPSPAIAADFGGAPPQKYNEPPPASGWQFTAAPNGWLFGIYGDVTVRGHTVDVDESFIDIVENSDSLAALMGYFEARNGRFALFADIVWADVTFSGNIQRSANPIANLNILVSANAELDYELTIVQSGAAVEVARWANGAATTAVDVMGSARYWNHSVDVSVGVTATVDLPGIGFQATGSRAVARTGTLEWVDPVIGARLRHQTASGSELTVTGDIGGFGVGSDFSWQAIATYGRDISFFGMPVHTVVGYRALGVDYSEGGPFGGHGIDAVLHGPVVGAKFRW